MIDFIITGSNGYIGRNVLEFLSKDYKLLTINRSKPLKKIKKIKYLIHDLSKKLDKKISARCIIHMASVNDFTIKKNKFEEFYFSNIVSTENIVNFAKKNNIKKIIFFSSQAVYGNLNPIIINEKTPSYQVSNYGLSKLVSENIIIREKKNFDVYILRLPGVIGPNQNVIWPWLNIVRNLIKKNKPVKIFNINKKFNSIVDLENIIFILKKILKNKKKVCKVYNVSLNIPISLKDVLRKMIIFYNSSSKIITYKSKKNMSIIDNNYIQNDLKVKLGNVSKSIDKFLIDNKDE